LPEWPSFDVLLATLADESNTPEERLVSAERSTEIATIRTIFAFMAVRLWKQRQLTAAEVLHKESSTLSHLLRRSTISRDHPLIQRVLARLSIRDRSHGG